jgi:antitoxin Phd
MQVFTHSETRQTLAMVLDQAESTGKVLIRRKDGRTFAVIPGKMTASPLDAPSIKADISTSAPLFPHAATDNFLARSSTI